MSATVEHVEWDTDGPWRVSGWPDAPPIVQRVQRAGGWAWDEVTILHARWHGYRTQALAERAAALSYAEAATLHHAQYRLHDDPQTPHAFCITWKLHEGIPLTAREQAHLDALRGA